MAEVREFALPDLGEGLTEATVVQWMVAVGDVVEVDQPVVEVETAKAMVEVPCPYGGVVTARYGEEGAEIPVGAPLVTVAVGSPSAGGADGPSVDGTRVDGIPDGTSPDGVDGGAAPAPSEPAEAAAAAAASGSGNVLVGYGTSAPAARRRRNRARTLPGGPGGPREHGSAAGDGAAPTRGGRPDGGRQAAEEPPATDGRRGPVAVISPLVRRLAREYGVDLGRIAGSGPDGLILRADVERAGRSRAGTPEAAGDTAPRDTPATAGADGTAGSAAARRVPLTGLRGTVADKLSRSRREIPDATCWVDADATELLAARRAMNAYGEAHGAPKVPLLAVLARICTAALARFPELNATVDTEAREVLRLPEVHLGFAAQTDRGLVVPVVRDAHTLDAARLGTELSRLTESARAGTLTPRELTGGTFTLNNYGVFGVDGSTPILNHPEAAMLGVGRVTEKPWVVDGQLAVRHVVQLSLTFDHRVCDGGTAGGFLRYVADCVEAPAVLLRTL